MLTSNHNHLGKSVIMKSIYYTLGANVYYPVPIKRINMLTYIDFLLDKQQYRIARLKNSFVLYCGHALSGVYSSVEAFEEKLCGLFGLEINLIGKDKNGTIVKCPPAFYYLPYYIDQENGWAINSFSFSALIKENEKYLTVIETLQSGLDETQMSFDTTSLEHALSLRQDEIGRLLDGISSIRTELVEAEDQSIQLSHDKEILSKYIKMKVPITKTIDTEFLECPRCGKVFERSITQRLEKAYLLESLHDDYTNLSEQQVRLERRITRLKAIFSRKQ